MNILSLGLKAYGVFGESELLLDPARRVHVVYGANEAGKTTRRNAVADFLFGFDHRARYAFHADGSPRVTARIAIEGMETFFERRKGRVGTLRDQAGEPVAEDVLRASLGGLDREGFESRFSIGRDELRGGAEMLLRSGGELAATLYGVAMRSDPKAILAQLQKEADELFKPRASIPRINKHIVEYGVLQTEVRNATTQPEAWEKLMGKRDENARRITESGAKRARLENAVLRFERLVGILPGHEELLALRAERDRTAASGLVLSAHVVPALKTLCEIVVTREARFTEDRENLERIDEGEELEPDRPLLIENGAKIQAAYEKLGVLRAALAGRKEEKLDDRLQAALRDYERCVAVVRPHASGEEIRLRRPSERDLSECRKIASRHPVLIGNISSARQRVVDAKHAIVSHEAGLATIDGSLDATELEVALKAARAEGPLDKKIAEEEKKRRTHVASRDAAVAALPLFEGNAGDLRALRLPLLETIERFEQREAALEQTLRLKQSEVDRLGAVVKELSEKSIRFGDENAGTAEKLAALRAERDGVFEALITSWRAGESHDDRASDAYGDTIERADAYADSRFERAEAIAKAESARDELRRAEEARRKAEEERGKAREELDEHCRVWRILWNDVTASPLSPREMRAWFVKAEEARRLFDAAVALEADIAGLRAVREEHVNALRLGLAKIGFASENDDFEALRDIAAERLRNVRDEAVLRAELLKQAQTAHKTLSESLDMLATLEAELAAWEKAWGGILEALYLAPNVLPEDASALLEHVVKLYRAMDARDEYARRIGDIERERESYRALTRALFAIVSPDLLEIFDVSFETAVKELKDRWDAQNASATRRKEREKHRAALAAKVEAAQRALTQGTEQRDALACSLGVALVDAPAVIMRSEAFHGYASRVEMLERDLRLASRESIEAIDAEIAEKGAERLRADLFAGRSELAEEQTAFEASIEERRAISDEIARIEGSAAAAEKQGELLAIGASIDRDARRYAALTAAMVILRDQVERYAREHEAPIVSLASRYFNRITRGAWERVRVVAGEQDAVLEIIGNGKERGVEALSDGTRDELYFALRLATIRRFMERLGKPIPLILDDAFMNFDDERTAAAFEALGDFGESGQVIYFTHHRGVLAAAREALGDAVDIVELERPYAS